MAESSSLKKFTMTPFLEYNTCSPLRLKGLQSTLHVHLQISSLNSIPTLCGTLMQQCPCTHTSSKSTIVTRQLHPLNIGMTLVSHRQHLESEMRCMHIGNRFFRPPNLLHLLLLMIILLNQQCRPVSLSAINTQRPTSLNMSPAALAPHRKHVKNLLNKLLKNDQLLR